MNTDALIEKLIADARPVRPLASPWLRAGAWFALSALYTVAVIAAMPPGPRRLAGIHFSRFWLEQGAAATTGFAAAAAALLSVIPGCSRRWRFLPAAPLAVWLGILVSSCIGDVAERGAAGLLVHSDWSCSLAMLAVAFVPVAAMVFLLRRGAPLTPDVSAGLAGLAGAALSSVVACVTRPAPHPTTSTVVVWHMATLLVMVFVLVRIGHRALRWPTAPRLAAARGNASS